MARRRRGRTVFHVLAAGLLALASCTSHPTAHVRRTRSAPATSPAPSPTTGTTGPAGQAQSVRVEAPPKGSLLVRGRYPHTRSPCVHPHVPPLVARYPGTLRVSRARDGTLTLTLTLPFERYLDGIAEMPPSWPMAALEAQAIAARSYALATTGWTGPQGRTLRAPICATTSCQVYAGIPVPRDPTIHRWYRAVRTTSGEVLLFGDRPADTVYFSTSNGHTYGNDQVFGSAPLPYLRPVVERNDGASPTSRWRVRIPFRDLTRFLHAGGEWPGVHPISTIRTAGTRVVVSGGGSTRAMDVDTFRDAVNTWAPCLEPNRYPPGSLPQTIPSHWLGIASMRRAALVRGRGWGHGVGMVQWGARGKALLGYSASRILAFYYGGLRPRRYPEPGLIHVIVASGLASLRIVPSGPGAGLNGGSLGTGPVSITGGSRLTTSTGS